MKIRNLLIKYLRVGSSMHAIHIRQKILETQLDYLIKNSNRKLRRKWHRMLRRKTSPNYIGHIYNKDFI